MASVQYDDFKFLLWAKSRLAPQKKKKIDLWEGTGSSTHF
jgi:hypothetical protein